jgi:hypothetical protein
MPSVFTPTLVTGPVQQLSRAVVEGENAVDSCIADDCMAPMPLNNRTAHLPKMTVANTLWGRTIADGTFYRAPGSYFLRASAQIADLVLDTSFQGMEIAVPWETLAEWDDYMDLLAFFSTRAGKHWSKLTKELQVAATVFNTSNTYQGNATNSTVPYTYTNQQILGVGGMNAPWDIIEAARQVKALGERPNSVAMSGPMWERVSNSANTLQFCRGTIAPLGGISTSELESKLKEYGIDKVLVGDAYYNTAQDQDTPVLTQLWSNSYIAVFRRGMSDTPTDESNDVGVPTLSGLGCQFWWERFDQFGKGVTSGGTGTYQMDGGNFVRLYNEDKINSTIIQLGFSNFPQITNNKCNFLINPQYS